jgi:hypothetical protein
MTTLPMREIVFLLGSGASKPAGMPMVPDITDRVLSDTEVASDFDRGVLRLLRYIFERIRPVYEGHKPSRPPNYEDVAYVTRQVADFIMREHENPALLPFVDELKPVIGSSEVGLIYKFCDEATSRIKHVAASMLSVEPSRLDHLGGLLASCQEPGLRVTIATLNHDCVVEAALACAGIRAHDGFVGPNGDLFTFADAFPDGNAPHLLKLHGSIDWFRYQVPDPAGPGKHSIFVRSINPDKEHLRDGSGMALGYTADPHPQILVGTFSKIFDYTNFVFDDLHARLHQALKRSDLLIIVGYGGQDKAINSKVIHWMDEDARRVTVLVDPNPGNLLKAGRPAIQANLNYWQKLGRLRVIPRGVESVTWPQMLGA